MRSRNLAFERDRLRRIQDAGFTGPSTAGEYLLRGQNAILSFFARDLPQLQKEWKVSIGSRFQHVTRGVERITPKLEIIGSGEDWFDFSFSVESAGGQQFSTAEVQRLLQVGQNVTRLRDGRLAILDTDGLEEFQAILRDCDPAQSRPGTYRIERSQAAYVDAAFGELAGASIQSTREWENWTRAQRQLVPLEPEPLGSLEGISAPVSKGRRLLVALSQPKWSWAGFSRTKWDWGKPCKRWHFCVRSMAPRWWYVLPHSFLTGCEKRKNLCLN